MAQIELINLTKIYPVGEETFIGVNDISLQLEKGEFISIVGHSGSGKTTLISIIGGILKPTSGQVLVEGTDICTLNDDALSEYRNKRIGFMFQFASLLPILTAKENVILPGMFASEKNKHMVSEKKAEEYLKLVGVGDKMNSNPAQLSGGQQRRVAIARALINEPDFILADEPTGDLDEQTEAEILQLFRTINQEKGVTILLITHNMELAKSAGRQLKMTNGSIVEL